MTRLYPLVAVGGVLFAAIAFVAGEAGSGMWSGGIAALAVVAGMRAVRAPCGGWPERLMLGWAAAALLLAAVPAGVPALVVTFLSAATLLSLPIATGLLVPRLAEDERWRAVARPMEWLALAGGLGLAVTTYVALPGHQALLGPVERGLLAIEVATLGVLALRLLGLTWGAALERAGVIEWARMVIAAVAARVTRGTRVLG